MINKKGQEVLDTTPVELPVGYKAPLPLAERMKQMIRDELSTAAAAEGFESWEEANDFDVGEDDDRMFNDVDEDIAVNDPNVEHAYHQKKDVVLKSLKDNEMQKKAEETVKQNEDLKSNH